MERSVLKMPAVALRGMTILPGMITHFDVSRSRSAKAVERSVAQDQKLFVVTQKDPETENPDKDGLFSIGTIVEVKQIIKMPQQYSSNSGRRSRQGRALRAGRRRISGGGCLVKSRISWKKGCRKRLCSEICRIFLKGIRSCIRKNEQGYGPPDRKLSDCAEYDGTDIHSCPISLGRASAVSGDREF